MAVRLCVCIDCAAKHPSAAGAAPGAAPGAHFRDGRPRSPQLLLCGEAGCLWLAVWSGSCTSASLRMGRCKCVGSCKPAAANYGRCEQRSAAQLASVCPPGSPAACPALPLHPSALQVQHELECSGCGRTSRVVEEYMHLSLELPEPQVSSCKCTSSCPGHIWSVHVRVEERMRLWLELPESQKGWSSPSVSTAACTAVLRPRLSNSRPLPCLLPLHRRLEVLRPTPRCLPCSESTSRRGSRFWKQALVVVSQPFGLCAVSLKSRQEGG